MLLGFTFLFAFMWKLLGSEYLTGEFLHFTFLTDGRLELPARIIGGFTPDVLPANQLRELLLKTIPHEGVGVALATNDRLRAAAVIVSY